EWFPSESEKLLFASTVPGQMIDEVLLEPQLRRRWRLCLVLFLATCLTTFLAGVYRWPTTAFSFDQRIVETIAANWRNGLRYMLAVIGILLTHEMGHF